MRGLDDAMRDFGLPMGPFVLMDEIGIPVIVKAAAVIAEAYPERAGPTALLHGLESNPRLRGQAGGEGFYLYRGASRRPNPAVATIVGAPAGARNAPSAEAAKERILLAMVNEAAACLREKVSPNAAYLDLAMIMGTGFPATRGGPLRWADETGSAELAHSLDRLAARLGDRFRPDELLLDMARTDRSFYP